MAARRAAPAPMALGMLVSVALGGVTVLAGRVSKADVALAAAAPPEVAEAAGGDEAKSRAIIVATEAPLVAAGAEAPPELPFMAAFMSRVVANHTRKVEAAVASGEVGERGMWKWDVRKRVWDHMEAARLAWKPIPAHARSPNFVGSDDAAARLQEMPEFASAKVVFVGRDAQNDGVRVAVLRAGKTLVMPYSGMREKFLAVVEPSAAVNASLSWRLRDVQDMGKAVGMEWRGGPVDLIVAGSVAVNPYTGDRIGRGVGMLDLRYAVLRHMKAVTDRTLVATLVHDCQVVEDIPSERMLKYDVPVDIIVTPTSVRLVERAAQPSGDIYWDLLSPQKLGGFAVLGALRARLEAEGAELSTGPAELLAPSPFRNRAQRRGRRAKAKA